MSFNSLIFLFFFLPVFFFVFFITPIKYRYLVLFIFSIIFYFYCGLFNGILLVIVALSNYFLARLCKKNNIVFYLSIILNIAVLALFKYNKSLLLPLGISFYTFNNISYLIDIKKNKIIAEKNLLRFFTYEFLFTHVTMGPIVNYNEINNSLFKLNPSFSEVADGFKRFLNGLIKKVLFADNLGILYQNLYTASVTDSSMLLCWLCIIVFAIQLYLDFSGYTDMALGLGKMIGITYPENFDYPYLATSISDFWRKWHMSLTNFFKNYVYIPLGGNRVKKLCQLRNILIVWILTGIWHGSTFNFLLWGLYYGIILILEKYFINKYIQKLPKFLKHFYVIFFVLIGYVFFSITDFNSIFVFMRKLFSGPIINNAFLFYLKENIFLLFIGLLLCLKIPNYFKQIKNNKIVSYLIMFGYIFMYFLIIAYILSGNYQPFLYNNF